MQGAAERDTPAEGAQGSIGVVRGRKVPDHVHKSKSRDHAN